VTIFELWRLLGHITLAAVCVLLPANAVWWWLLMLLD